MRFVFTLLILLFTVINSVVSQNVMSHLDVPVVYNATASVGTAANPIVPLPGIMTKWVYDPTQKPGRIPWNQSRFKAYYFNGMAYRIRFPKNYDPNSGIKYPLVLFMHGAGEAAPRVAGNCPGVNYENQDQLFWGAQTFDNRIEADEWNGFLLFPQQNCNQSGGWDFSMFDPINNVLDTLQKYHGFDQNRVIVMGLSSGGAGNIAYASYFPKRVAAIATSDPAFGHTDANALKYIPTWVANGGLDPRPTPGQVNNFINSIRDLGGDTYQNYYATGGHSSWNKMWAQKNITGSRILTSYWNRAHKANPIVLYGRTKVCTGTPISVRIGINNGYYSYEWQKNTGNGFITIAEATSNEYVTNETGSFRVRFKADSTSDWSGWSPQPAVVSWKACGTDTVFAERFEHYGAAPAYLYFGPSWGYRNYNFFRQSGLFVPGSEGFTQDASGNQGGRFLFNHTYPSITTGGADQTTPYAAGDQVWRYYDGITVTPNTNYVFSFYAANITTITPRVQLVTKINGVTLTPTNTTPTGSGNGGWTKYNYIWNSGFNTVAYPELINNTSVSTTVGASSNGNDFVVDDITLTKLLAPGGVSGGMQLWTKPESLNGTPENGITIWSNSAGKTNLVQATQASKPFQTANATEDINFNSPAVFSLAGQDFLRAASGFSGTAVHNAAHVFTVAVANNTTTTESHLFLRENQTTSSSNRVEIYLPRNGKVSWAAGNLTTNFTQANFTSNDVNKPFIWSFSKSNAGTASGFKQDIRKNGLVVASGNNTGTFTGNNSLLQLGQFDGKVAELIYYLDANITPADQSRIESYLALKYGLTLGDADNIRDYIASDGTVVWPGNAQYQNDVFGIGADANSGLRQSISNSMNTGSGNGKGQLKKGNIVVSVDSVLADKSFLLMGHSLDTLGEQSNDLPANTTGALRIAREWKVASTGSIIPVEISFDTTGITYSGAGDLTNFRLLIDEDGDGDFNTGTINSIAASTSEGKTIRFANINFANNSVFTFTTLAPTNRFTPVIAEEVITRKADNNERSVDIVKQPLKIAVASNPVKGNMLLLQIKASENAVAAVQIVNTNGAVVLQRNINITPGNTLLPLATPQLANGMYLVRIQTNNGKKITERFVKTK